MTNERLLTIDQTAERLQIGRSLAYVLLQRGELVSIKIGRARRVPSQSVDEYIQRLREEQAPAA